MAVSGTPTWLSWGYGVHMCKLHNPCFIHVYVCVYVPCVLYPMVLRALLHVPRPTGALRWSCEWEHGQKLSGTTHHSLPHSLHAWGLCCQSTGLSCYVHTSAHTVCIATTRNTKPVIINQRQVYSTRHIISVNCCIWFNFHMNNDVNSMLYVIWAQTAEWGDYLMQLGTSHWLGRARCSLEGRVDHITYTVQVIHTYTTHTVHTYLTTKGKVNCDTRSQLHAH